MFEEIIQKCILQVRRECSFFGSLMLFAEIEKSKTLPTAATDGRKIFFNEDEDSNLKTIHTIHHYTPVFLQ